MQLLVLSKSLFYMSFKIYNYKNLHFDIYAIRGISSLKISEVNDFSILQELLKEAVLPGL